MRSILSALCVKQLATLLIIDGIGVPVLKMFGLSLLILIS